MIKDLRWKTETTKFIGRNGYFQCIGIEMHGGSKIVTLQPTTSKGDTGRCSIEIPISEIPALIENLIAFIK